MPPAKNHNWIRNITTGVHCANSIAWLWEKDSIDLFAEQQRNSPQADLFECCSNTGPQLFGSWVRKNGCYYPSLRDEMSAIFDPDTNTVQVIRSNHIIKCHHCSPCYPNQGDVDTAGDLWAYCLPPYLMEEGWIKENGRRIFKRKKSPKGNYYWKKRQE
jgi:hypothetical protein